MLVWIKKRKHNSTFLKILFIREREGEWAQAGGAAGRGRRRLPAEQGARSETQSQDPKIMTPAEGRSLTDWVTQASPQQNFLKKKTQSPEKSHNFIIWLIGICSSFFCMYLAAYSLVVSSYNNYCILAFSMKKIERYFGLPSNTLELNLLIIIKSILKVSFLHSSKLVISYKLFKLLSLFFSLLSQIWAVGFEIFSHRLASGPYFFFSSTPHISLGPGPLRCSCHGMTSGPGPCLNTRWVGR